MIDWDDTADDESEFCPCGAVLMGDPDEGDGRCGVCVAAPHDRECSCYRCEGYWSRIAKESRAAQEAGE